MSLLIKGLAAGSVIVLVLAGLAIAFHDTAFRWVASRLAQQVPGLEVHFDGGFDVTQLFPLTLNVEGLRLAFEGQEVKGVRTRIGKLYIEMRPWPLMKGVIDIKQLTIADADLEIPYFHHPTTLRKPPINIRMPFVEELLLQRISVRFQLEPGDERHEFNIASLMAGSGEGGLLRTSATTSLDGNLVELSAVLGSIDEFLHPTALFPVNATLRAPRWDIKAEVLGTLAMPVQGRGAEFDIRATASDISPLLKLFLADAPFAGRAVVAGRISGDLRTPELLDFDLSVNDGERLRMTVAGKMANLWGLGGLDLQAEVASEDPTVTRYLIRDALPTAGVVRVAAGIRGGAGSYVIEDLDAEMTGANGLSAGASGAVHIAKLESEWPIEEAHLDVHLSGSVIDLGELFTNSVSRTGTLRAQARIDGSAQSVVFSKVDLVLDEARPLGGTVQGEFTYRVDQFEAIRTHAAPTVDAWLPAAADIRLDITATDLKVLSAAVGRDLPDLGPLSAKARLRRNGDTIEVTDLDARTTGQRSLSLTTKGQLAVADITSKQIFQDLDLALEAKGPNAESVAPILGSLPLDPGPWSLQARVKTKASKLSVEALEFEAGRADAVRIELEGNIPDLKRLLDSKGASPDGVRLKGHLSGGSTEKLGELIGQPIFNVGQFDARFEARGGKDDWSVPTASIEVTGGAGFDFRATGAAGQLLRDPSIEADLQLQIPDPPATVSSIGGSIPQVSPILLDGRLEGRVDTGVFFDGHVDVGSTQFQTLLEVELGRGRPKLSGTISTSLLQLGDFLVPGASTDESAPKPSGRQKARGERVTGPDSVVLSNERLPFDLLDHADVDVKLIAEKIDGERIRTERLELMLRVDSSHLKAHHKPLKYESGALTTALEVDNGTDPPRVTLKGRANNISLGALHAQVSDSPELLEGLFSFDVDLTTSGRSPHELAAASNGHYGHVMEDTKIAGGNLDLLALGVLQLVMTTVESKDHTDIDCGIAKFRLSNGVANSEALFLHTPKMVAAGTGQLDFGDETLDLLVNTETKRLLLKRRTVLRVYGPMQNLKVQTNLKQRAVGAAVETAAGAALPPLGFTVAGLSFLAGFIDDGEKKPCIPTDYAEPAPPSQP